MLSFVEEITLLLLDDTRGRFIDMPVTARDVVIAGAALMDLSLAGQVDTDLERLIVVDTAATGDDILDDARSRLGAPADDADLATAVEALAPFAKGYTQRALQRLVTRRILREERGRFLWVFPTRSYPVIDETEQREVKARLREILLTDEIPDPRDIALICLIEACNLLGLVLTTDELKHGKGRIEQLQKMDLIGQTVTRTVDEIRFRVKHGTPPIS